MIWVGFVWVATIVSAAIIERVKVVKKRKEA